MNSNKGNPNANTSPSKSKMDYLKGGLNKMMGVFKPPRGGEGNEKENLHNEESKEESKHPQAKRSEDRTSSSSEALSLPYKPPLEEEKQNPKLKEVHKQKSEENKDKVGELNLLSVEQQPLCSQETDPEHTGFFSGIKDKVKSSAGKVFDYSSKAGAQIKNAAAIMKDKSGDAYKAVKQTVDKTEDYYAKIKSSVQDSHALKGVINVGEKIKDVSGAVGERVVDMGGVMGEKMLDVGEAIVEHTKSMNILSEQTLRSGEDDEESKKDKESPKETEEKMGPAAMLKGFFVGNVKKAQRFMGKKETEDLGEEENKDKKKTITEAFLPFVRKIQVIKAAKIEDIEEDEEEDLIEEGVEDEEEDEMEEKKEQVKKNEENAVESGLNDTKDAKSPHLVSKGHIGRRRGLSKIKKKAKKKNLAKKTGLIIIINKLNSKHLFKCDLFNDCFRL
jgi:hypothetical protein